jgi:hypothetical protein
MPKINRRAVGPLIAALVCALAFLGSGSGAPLAHAAGRHGVHGAPRRPVQRLVSYPTANARQVSPGARAALSRELLARTSATRHYQVASAKRLPHGWLVTAAPRRLRHGMPSNATPRTMFNVIVLHRHGRWQAATGHRASQLLRHVPRTGLTNAARRALFPAARAPVAASQQFGGYLFPWPATKNGAAYPWQVRQGWHDCACFGFAALQGIDFGPIDAGNSSILAAASGVVASECRGSGGEAEINVVTDGTSEKLGYLHLDLSSVDAAGISPGVHITQGQVIGHMWDVAGEDNCGHSTGTHLHMYFPTKPFAIDGVDFTAGDDHAGQTVYSHQNGLTPGTPVASNLTAASVTLSWSGSAGAASYQVLRDGAVVASTTATSYTDTHLLGGTRYTYVIRAADGGGRTADSGPLTVTTPKAGVDVVLRSDGTSGWTLDSNGDLSAFGGAPPIPANQESTWNWGIARRAVRYDDNSGYVLDGWGGIHPFWAGSQPPPSPHGGPYWQNWDIARDIALLPNRHGGYVLDGYGGVHAFALGSHAAPPAVRTTAYWKNWDIARALDIEPAGKGGYVLDGYGGLHPFALGHKHQPPSVAGSHWPNWDIARDVVIGFDGHSGYTLDGFGGIHPFAAKGVPNPPRVSGRYTPGSDVARGLALATTHGSTSGVVAFSDLPTSASPPFGPGVRARSVVLLRGSATAGYTLAGDGTIQRFGGAPRVHHNPSWPAWDIARQMVLLPNGHGGYVLDGYGGLHAFAIGHHPVPAAAHGGPYWPNWDIARSFVLLPKGHGGYVLDGYGGIHPFGIGAHPVPHVAHGGSYWPNWDIARSVALLPDGHGGYVLDGYGGVHPFGIGKHPVPLAARGGAYWPNWDIARSVILTGNGKGGYVLDGYGALHAFATGKAPMPRRLRSAYFPGWDVAVAVAVHGKRGELLDSYGSVHRVR